MNRFNQVLGAALAIQFVIATSLYFNSKQPLNDQAQMALLNGEQNQIDYITIEERDGKQTVLSKVAGKWQLPDYYQLPANQNKVLGILNTLTTTKSGWPIATTASSRERFEVSDENFQKKVLLRQGSSVIETLYLGTSPGFRQLHIRRGDDNNVYTVKLNSFDFPSQHTNWLDKTLLTHSGKIASIKTNDYAFNRKGDDWLLSNDMEEKYKTPIKEEIDKLVNTLANLTVQGAEETSPNTPVHEIRIIAAGKALTYQFFKKDRDFYVSRNDFAQAFKISQSDYEKIASTTEEHLVKYSYSEENTSVVDSTAENIENVTASENKHEEMKKDNS